MDVAAAAIQIAAADASITVGTAPAKALMVARSVRMREIG